MSDSYALELRAYCHPGAPSMPSLLLLGSLGLDNKQMTTRPKTFCELVSYLTLNRLLTESGRDVSRSLLVRIIVQ